MRVEFSVGGKLETLIFAHVDKAFCAKRLTLTEVWLIPCRD